MRSLSLICPRKPKQCHRLDKSDRFIERLLIQAAAPAARAWIGRSAGGGAAFKVVGAPANTPLSLRRHFPCFPLPVGAHAVVNHAGESTKCQGWCSRWLNHRKSAPSTSFVAPTEALYVENGAIYEIFFLWSCSSPSFPWNCSYTP